MGDPDPIDLLRQLDATLTEACRLRDLLAKAIEAGEPAADEFNSTEVDDLSEPNLIDTTSAAARFNFPRNTLTKWAREEDLGVKIGGRWLVSVPRLRRRLNGS